jgi:hypothetical protein
MSAMVSTARTRSDSLLAVGGASLGAWVLGARWAFRRADAPVSADRPLSVRDASARAAADLARDQLAAEMSGLDSDDIRSIGLLGIYVAGAALMISVRNDLDRFWHWSVVGLGVASTLLLIALWRRDYDMGPPPSTLFEVGSTAADDTSVAVLLFEGVDDARTWTHGVRRHKMRWQRSSFAMFAVTIASSIVYLLAVH